MGCIPRKQNLYTETTNDASAENEHHCELLRNELQKNTRIVAEQTNTIFELEAKYNETLNRLSAMASAKLTDGNANIADLSDENRPTKLAEKFSELYDNEWTNAFEYLTETKTLNEDFAISILLKVLCTVYKYCKERAEADYNSMLSGIQLFLAIKDQEVPKDIIKPLKDARKKKFRGHFASFEKEVKEKVQIQFQNDIDWNVKATKDYLRESLELSWLMAIQDPPVYMDTNFSTTNEQFDSNVFKQYTKSGSSIDFIVWPALYLCENGSLLIKGVAQGKDIIITPEIESTDL